MTQVRFPLFAKILLWFFLNLGFLAAVLLLVVGAQFQFGLDSLITGRAGERIRALSEALVRDLQSRPAPEWDAALERFGAAYGVTFALVRRDGAQVAGQHADWPPEVLARIAERHSRGAGRGGPAMGRGPMHAQQQESLSSPQPRFLVHTERPSRYWIGVCVPLFVPDEPWPLTLLLSSPSLLAGGLLVDYTPWLAAGFGGVLLSVLFWFPLVRDLTRAVSQITCATEDIANGRFNVRVNGQRADELGRLGQAVNRMAERLSTFVSGQKRFLGDIAHELGSPLARLQMALGVMEDHVGQAEVADAREEVEHMSKLVHELLSFSRASLERGVNLQPVNVAELVRGVIEREAVPAGVLQQAIEPGLCVRADPDLIARAVANLVRNAVRYAAAAGPVELAAARVEHKVSIRISDRGPGVPPDLLQRVFDPFFRAEPSRSRETGGAGLGLAIVKTCVEACRGSVSARNREPSGFEVEMILEPAEGPENPLKIT